MSPQPVARFPLSLALPQVARWVLLFSAIALLAACASSPQRRQPTYKASHSALAELPPRAPSAASAGEANDILFRAIGLVGTPYRWGGNTPAGGFDCSGLVDYIYRTAAGIKLPRTSHDMASMDAHKVRKMTQLASGDLVFFDIGGAISHVGVYVGKGRFVHAPNSGGTVRLDDIDGPYWGGHFAYGKRVLD
ncbi:cell wall-associated hydrolase, invasion-associated protein [Rhodanobacter denitrificans]|uniref:Cell wall-associated hydrolase, invasion-associated protein n=1 Tax=Rhodanobacter denitrificans TaxID=666685 RepID=M4NEF0_9GAMM|nr:cell wall-associated hydrolase, invasion-associated protein [Rhodanobacter denitrificans]